MRSNARFRVTAVAGVMAMVAVACGQDVDVDFEDDEPDEAVEEPDDEADDDPEDPDQALAVPAGAFGPECQRLLESVESPEEQPGAVGEDAVDNGDGLTDDDNGLTDDDDGLTDDDDNGLTDDDENGLADDDAVDDGTADTAPGTDDAGAQLASLSMLEAIEAIPDLRPLSSVLQGLQADLEGADQITVFAPTAEAVEGLSQAIAGGTADDGGTTDDTGLADDDDDVTDDDDGLTDDDDGLTDDGATDDTGLTDDGAASTDTDRIARAHVHQEAALDVAALIDTGPISTLDDGRELEVRVEEDGAQPDADTDTDADADADADADTDGSALQESDGMTVVVEGQDAEATVLCANLETADGYLHVIDTLLVAEDELGGGEPGMDDDDDGLLDDDDDEGVLDDEDDLTDG